MGRIRTVKPELFLDEVLGCLTGDHVMLFIGLLTVADREGRLPWRPARLKATLFPYREVDVAGLGADLDAADKVQLYSSDGEEYLWIPGFVRHQRPHPKEPESVLPAAPSREKKRRAVEGPSSFPSSPVGREGKGREGDLEGDPLAAGAAVPVEPPEAAPTPAQKPRQRAPAPARATNGGGELVLEAQTPHEPARARQALIAALGESFREIRGATYAYQGRDWKALDRLRAQQTDEEILRRWERGLRAQYKARVDSIADLEQRWNANATPERGSAATAPPIDENGDCALCKARPGEPHRDWCQRGRKTG